MIALIAAYDKNRVIGCGGHIPWKIEGEQRRFRDLTMGNAVIMGRKTYEEIGRPLPGRLMIILSKTKSFDGCLSANSLSRALELAGGKDVYISGGAGLYKTALPLCERLYITEIEGEFEGDVFFPDFDESLYKKEIVSKTRGKIPYTYLTYTKL